LGQVLSAGYTTADNSLIPRSGLLCQFYAQLGIWVLCHRVSWSSVVERLGLRYHFLRRQIGQQSPRADRPPFSLCCASTSSLPAAQGKRYTGEGWAIVQVWLLI